MPSLMHHSIAALTSAMAQPASMCCCVLQVFLVLATSVVGFISVLVGRWLQLDYSAKLYVMTFVLVVMAAEHSSGVGILWRRPPLCNSAQLLGRLPGRNWPCGLPLQQTSPP